MTSLRLTSPGQPEAAGWHLSVDGMSPLGPNLSHWPGNRTPSRFKADLSTGICLEFCRASASEQARFLAGAEWVLNDHYDTDGFLSLLSVLRPDFAVPRGEILLEAAATGDFQAFRGERGFAIDRIVVNLASAASPVADQFQGLAGEALDFARYRWLIDHAEVVIDQPEELVALFEAELAAVQAQLVDGTVEAETLPDLGLALIRSPDEVHRRVLNTKADRCFRVLHTQGDALYRFHDRTESWFEVQTFAPLPRRDLEPLRGELAAREAPESSGEWCLDAMNQPVPELYHGLPSTQAYGQLTRQLTPSSLARDEVEELFAAFFAHAGDSIPRRHRTDS